MSIFSSSDVTLTISVTDYNDNAPAFTSLTYQVSLSEVSNKINQPVAERALLFLVPAPLLLVTMTMYHVYCEAYTHF